MGDRLVQGKEIGDYRIVGFLGSGAMGEVYEAEQTHLGRHYALKVLPATHSQDADFRERFRQEARMLASLDHPNVVAIHNAAEVDGCFFLVMELLKPLQVKPGERVDPEEVRRMLGQVLSALDYAHRQGVVHRDLKPANLLMSQEGRLKVSDFGVARVLGDDYVRSIVMETIQKSRMSESETLLETQSSRSGELVGTLQYMAPEVLDGHPADARVDIYAVGVMAYEWLTGKKPIGRYKDASKLVLGLNPGWDTWLDKMMAPDLDERMQSAEEALKQLSQVDSAPAARKEKVAPMPPSVTRKAAVGNRLPKPDKDEEKQISKRTMHGYRRSVLTYLGILAQFGGFGLYVFVAPVMLFILLIFFGIALMGTSFVLNRSKAMAEWRETKLGEGRADAVTTTPGESVAPQKRSGWRARIFAGLAVVVLASGAGYLYWLEKDGVQLSYPENVRYSFERFEPVVEQETRREVEQVSTATAAQEAYNAGFVDRYWYEKFDSAIEHFRKAAELGHHIAPVELALALMVNEYSKVELLGEDDEFDFDWDVFEQAVDLAVEHELGVLSRAAEGSAHDQVVLSQLYAFELLDHDETGPEHPAMIWARAAADQGYYLGEFLLAGYHFNGFLVDVDEAQAYDWYYKAAVQGHTYSMMSLGVFHELGVAVDPDIEIAKQWYALAAERGYERAKLKLAELSQ